MAPTSKTKRKSDSDPKSDDSKKPRAEDNSDADSDGEAPPEQTPEQIAMQMFAASAAKPAPEVKHSSSGNGSLSLEGVVVHTKKITVSGKKGNVGKMMITVMTNKVIASSGPTAVIPTNVDGIAFGLPSKQLEASPEDIAKDPNARGDTVLDINDDNSPASYLGKFSASFYLEAGAGKADAKGKTEETPSTAACVPGTLVLVSGVSCVNKGGVLYANAKKIVPLQGPIEVGKTAASIISHMSSPSAQQTAAFLLSSTVGGFFDVKYTEDVQIAQAKAFKGMWEDFTKTTSNKCTSLASAYKSTDPSVADVLTNHAKRIEKITGQDAAKGSSLFNVDMPKDCVTSYVAAIMQKDAKPTSPIYGQAADLFNAKKRDELPNTFVDAKVVGVQYRGNLIIVDYKLTFVADKELAVAAILDGKNPVLQFENVTASVKLSVKSVGPELVGSVDRKKVEMFLREAMPYMDHVAFASVYPRSANDTTVDGHFTSTTGFDVKDGITKVGVRISQKFLNDKMLGGRGVMIFNQADDVDVIEPANGVGPNPTLSKSCYQAVSEGSFDFDSLKGPEGKEIQFFVVYEGCNNSVRKLPGVSTSTEEGEAHLVDILPAMREDSDMKAFLREDALVYAVAV